MRYRGGSHQLCNLRQPLLAACALFAAMAMLPAAAMAWTAETTSALHLRQGPSTRTAVIATMPAGASVAVSGCNNGWCRANWRGYAGYASQMGLTQQEAANGQRHVHVLVTPILPDYPYQAGYYPTADSYFKYPPYAEEKPNFYRRRTLLSPREHDRYRYMPHIFTSSDAAAETRQ